MRKVTLLILHNRKTFYYLFRQLLLGEVEVLQPRARSYLSTIFHSSLEGDMLSFVRLEVFVILFLYFISFIYQHTKYFFYHTMMSKYSAINVQCRFLAAN